MCLQWWAFTPVKIHHLQDYGAKGGGAICPGWTYILNFTVVVHANLHATCSMKICMCRVSAALQCNDLSCYGCIGCNRPQSVYRFVIPKCRHQLILRTFWKNTTRKLRGMITGSCLHFQRMIYQFAASSVTKEPWNAESQTLHGRF